MLRELRSILIVESHLGARQRLQNLIPESDRYSYQVIEAWTGIDGLEQYHRHHPNAILLAQTLSDMTGIEFLQRLQQQFQLLRLPVILILEAHNSHLADLAIQSGAMLALELENLSTKYLQLALHSTIEQGTLQRQLIEIQNDINSNSMISLMDATKLKQAEVALIQKSRQEQLLWQITQAIRQSLDLKTTLDTAVREIRQLLQTDRVAVYRFSSDWSGDFIVESVDAKWVKLVEPDISRAWEDTYLQETEGGCFRDRENFVIPDIYTAGLRECHIELLEQFQAKAYAVAPIFSGDFLWGLLAIYQNDAPRNWLPWEIDLLEQIASQLAIAIHQSELYGQLQTELQERKQAEAIARESERRWRSLFESTSLAVISLDRRGTITAINPFFLNLTGYTEVEVIGRNYFELFIGLEHRQHLWQQFQTYLQQELIPSEKTQILTKLGDHKVINWSNTLLRDSKGNLIGVTGIGEDITQRQAVEKLKDEFIAIVSHELRTPLTSIRGSLGLLAAGVMDDDPTAMKRMIEIASLDTERLVRLVNDMLDLEKLDSGKVPFVKELCDARDLMQRAIAVMESFAQTAEVTLELQPISAQFLAAPDRIIQTFTNLLSNAIKFSFAGDTVVLGAKIINAGEPLRRYNAINSTALAQHILFWVCDRGRGIPADKLETIFGRFQQVDASDSRDKGGTGLGLAICKSIVQQHNGQIWAESELNQGSTFFLALPM